MDEMKKKTEEALNEVPVVEKAPFEPAPLWKRIGAWVLAAIVIIGTINWLISIAYPRWPDYIMGLFK